MAKKPPVKYSKEVGAMICKRLALGMSLHKAVDTEGMPAFENVWIWLWKYPEFKEMYDTAKREGGEAMSENMMKIVEEDVIVGDDKSDNARVQQQRLRVDTIKWTMSKLLPRKYGDKLDVTTNGKDLPTPLYGGLSGNK